MSVGEMAYGIIDMLAVGVIEELLFRGMLRGSLSRVMSPVGAILVSSVLFSVMHVPACLVTNPSGMGFLLPFAFVFGLVASVTADACDSTIPGIICHCLYDILGALA